MARGYRLKNTNTLKECVFPVTSDQHIMSQRIIYEILKNDLNGSGTGAQIKKILKDKYPDISGNTVNDKLTRLRKWGCIGYITHRKTWFITGEFE